MRIRAAVGLVALVACVLPAAGPASPACAAGAPHAALVISTGGDVLRFCVALDAPSVSGLRLIELAHDQYGLSYRSDGAAVCMLAGTGPTGGDCFGAYPDYWGYWRGSASGGWIWSGSGAASTTVRGGGVEGWSWGSGDNGTTHPAPPRTAFGAVCRSPSPAASPTPSATHSPPGATPSPLASLPAAPASSPSPRRSRAPRPSRSHQRPRNQLPAAKRMTEARAGPLGASASPTPSSLVVSGVHLDRSNQGLPAAGVMAVIVAAALLGGGWFLLRRRHLSA
ncbi:MAG: hypothetical protein QOH48_2315 [Actinomycetota bacterium]|nr:hypothetical protein [Actinomycetota bacterium]